MSQGQPRRPPQDEAAPQVPDQPIKYGDVLDVTGELAGRPVAPRDAALLQSAEQAVLGQTQRGGPAAFLQSAAERNARAGHVGKGQITGPAADAGATVTETEAELPGRRVVTESVGGQAVAKLVTPAPVADPLGAADQDAMTIGRALEAVAATAAGGKPVDKSDTAAIQAAEMCATASSAPAPGGVAAAAQAAAHHNARAARGEDKVKLRDVLSNAREKMPADKGATGEDAKRVVSAEIRNKLDMATTPGGVAEAVTTAAKFVTPASVLATDPSGAGDQEAVTIGRALEAVAATAAGLKAVDQSDAAAVQAAEMCATASSATAPGGVAAAAQAAADHNARTACDANKVKLRDVLSNAREKMPADRAAMGEDAERVLSAEMRNKLDMATTLGGVAEAVITAARLNQERP